MSWTLDGRPLRRVLVSRLRYLGDIAMSTVVLAALRRGDPALTLDFLCEADYAPLLADHPDLDTVHALAGHRRGADARARAASHAASPPPSRGPESGAARGTIGTIRALRRARYDLAVDLFFNPRSAWLLRLAAARYRTGGAVGRWRARLYTHNVDAPRMSERPRFRSLAPGGLGDHLARLAPLLHAETGRPFLEWFEAAYAESPPRPRVASPRLADGGAAAAALAALGIGTGADFLLLAPAATWATKEWPAERWTELAGLLAERYASPIAILSPPEGPRSCGRIAQAAPGGRGGLLVPLPLGEALRVVAAARLVVCVDGGLMHAAVAMGRPTVALFGPTDPGIWFPYCELGPYRVVATRPPCHPCDRHQCEPFVCLPDLAARDVVRVVESLLSASLRPQKPV